MPHRVPDSSQASVQPGASLCNHTHLTPHITIISEAGINRREKKAFSTISTPQCEDRERKAGSGVEVVTYYAESVHLAYFAALQSDHRRAN